MTTSTTSESSTATPLLDLHALVVSVRRRRRLWCTMALLGFLIGAAVAVLMPPPPSAMTKVLVAHAEDQPNDTGTLIRTDVALLQTTRIADMALKSLKSSEKPGDFMKDYRGTGLTNNLLQIDVTGDSDAQAVARAKALADAFVADHVKRMQDIAQAESKALLDQRDRTRDELATVNKEISDRSTALRHEGGGEHRVALRPPGRTQLADLRLRPARRRRPHRHAPGHRRRRRSWTPRARCDTPCPRRLPPPP